VESTEAGGSPLCPRQCPPAGVAPPGAAGGTRCPAWPPGVRVQRPEVAVPDTRGAQREVLQWNSTEKCCSVLCCTVQNALYTTQCAVFFYTVLYNTGVLNLRTSPGSVLTWAMRTRGVVDCGIPVVLNLPRTSPTTLAHFGRACWRTGPAPSWHTWGKPPEYNMVKTVLMHETVWRGCMAQFWKGLLEDRPSPSWRTCGETTRKYQNRYCCMKHCNEGAWRNSGTASEWTE